jgi:16S rRNA (cytosine967-C5)-methyltransferase
LRPARPAQRHLAGAQRPPPLEATPGYSARWVAAQAIGEALTHAKPLEERFPGADGEPGSQGLDARDRALARSISTVAMRRLGTIRKTLGKFLEKGMPKKSGSLEGVLIAAAAQLLFLDVSDHAAVDLAVRAVRNDPASLPYSGVANAVLRNIARQKAEILETSDPFDDDTPAWLAARWRTAYGEETARQIARAHREEPTLDLTVKSDPEGWAKRLGGRVLPTGSVRLDSHVAIPELDGFAEGEWWVQDAAAAMPARLLRVAQGERALDLCAAPGGKCAQLALAGAAVSAVDRSAQRLKRLAANLARLNLVAELSVASATSYDAPPFDATLLDAPCSATGTIRRHPDVAWTKRPGDVATLVKLQSELLDRAEGEGQITALLRRNPDMRRVPIEASEIGGLAECVTPLGDLRTLPCHLPAETPRQSGLDGFFAARLQKRA